MMKRLWVLLFFFLFVPNLVSCHLPIEEYTQNGNISLSECETPIIETSVSSADEVNRLESLVSPVDGRSEAEPG